MKKYKSYLILGDYQFPYWTMIMGQLTIASTLLGVIGWAIYLLIDAIFFHKKPCPIIFKNKGRITPVSYTTVKHSRKVGGFSTS